jgi:hypothetical protein
MQNAQNLALAPTDSMPSSRIHPILSQVLKATERRSWLALEGSLTDIELLQELITAQCKKENTHFFTWNPGHQTPQQLAGPESDLKDARCGGLADLCKFLDKKGIWLIALGSDDLLSSVQQFNLINLLTKLRHSPNLFLLYAHTWAVPPILSQDIIPHRLLPPTAPELEQFLMDTPWSGHPGAIRCLQGLGWGELNQWQSQCYNMTPTLALEIAQNMRLQSLDGLGVQYMAQPDVPFAGGLEGLEAYLTIIQSLADPAAVREGLRLPKGIVLWGPPGTGKSLSAKLTAKKLGVPLVSVDWGGIQGTDNPDATLRQILTKVEAMAPVVMLCDDFDKALGWQEGGGSERSLRTTGKLLTWMQECDAPIFLMATINRLGLLPAEIIRRFDAMFFVDIPHRGARYQIFHLHLGRYFDLFTDYEFDLDNTPWDDAEWRQILQAYDRCTPDEIAKAIAEVARNKYFGNKIGQVTPSDLIEQSERFTPAMVHNEGQLYEIRQKATYAREAAGKDLSRFAVPPISLLED